MLEAIIGIVIGCVLTYVFMSRIKPSGTFFMDFSDPTKDVCLLELDESLDTIYYKKRVILNVKKKDFVSQD